MNKLEVLQRLADGEHCERVHQTQVWYIGNQACSPAVRALMAAGYLDGFFPSGKGYAYLTDSGKAYLAKRLGKTVA